MMRIDSAFPGGNIIVDAVKGSRAEMHQDLRDTQGNWFYWYFRVRGTEGKTVSFCFTRGDVLGSRGPAVSEVRRFFRSVEGESRYVPALIFLSSPERTKYILATLGDLINF